VIYLSKNLESCPQKGLIPSKAIYYTIPCEQFAGGKCMAFPCFCYKCKRLNTQWRLDDKYCMVAERRGCRGYDCNNCDLTCRRFIQNTPPLKEIIFKPFGPASELS
jgi:hypothetical protein